jgi:hypothetical protein
MTTNHTPRITVNHPGELLASIPHLLGFHPADSLVVLGLNGPSAATIGIVLRADLPPPSEARELAEYLLLPLAQHDSTAIAMIVIGGGHAGTSPDDLPHRELLARCESVLVDGGYPVVHQLWTPNTAGGHRWYCYDEDDCTGVLVNPATTPLAAAVADAGLTTYASRDDIVATLQPEPPATLASRSTSLDHLTDTTEPANPPSDDPTPDDSTRADVDTVQAAIAAAATKRPTLTDEDVIQLARALADHRVRDTCLDFDALPNPAAAERLWTALTRATPAPERAEAACLLAFSAYARGDGVLAGIALAQAEAADPGHRLAGLLRNALALGLPPNKLRVAGIRAATFARQAMSTNRRPTQPNPPQDAPAPRPDGQSTVGRSLDIQPADTAPRGEPTTELPVTEPLPNSTEETDQPNSETTPPEGLSAEVTSSEAEWSASETGRPNSEIRPPEGLSATPAESADTTSTAVPSGETSPEADQGAEALSTAASATAQSCCEHSQPEGLCAEASATASPPAEASSAVGGSSEEGDSGEILPAEASSVGATLAETSCGEGSPGAANSVEPSQDGTPPADNQAADGRSVEAQAAGCVCAAGADRGAA